MDSSEKYKTIIRVSIFGFAVVAAIGMTIIAASNLSQSMTPAIGIAIGVHVFAYFLITAWAALGVESFWFRQLAVFGVSMLTAVIGTILVTAEGGIEDRMWLSLIPLGFLGIQIPSWVLLLGVKRARMKLWDSGFTEVASTYPTLGNIGRVFAGYVIFTAIPLLIGLFLGQADSGWVTTVLATATFAPAFGIATAAAAFIGLVLPRTRRIVTCLMSILAICLLVTILVHAIQGFRDLPGFCLATSSIVACGMLYLVFPLYRAVPGSVQETDSP